MQQVPIENWSFTVVTDSPYEAPELATQRLSGIIAGHVNGPVVTSAIQGKRGENVVTHHTEYILGTIDPAYEAVFPNAKQRFLDSATEV